MRDGFSIFQVTLQFEADTNLVCAVARTTVMQLIKSAQPEEKLRLGSVSPFSPIYGIFLHR